MTHSFPTRRSSDLRIVPQLVAAQRRVADHRPRARIFGLAHRRPKLVDPRALFGRRKAVLAIEAVEKALLARLGRGAIVGQQDDDAVIEQPLVAQPIENAADLPVAMLDEAGIDRHIARSEEHTYELQSLMRIS